MKEISREEAIYILRNAAWLGSDKDRERTEQAVDIAVRVLRGEAYEYIKGYQDGAVYAAKKISEMFADKLAERIVNGK